MTQRDIEERWLAGGVVEVDVGDIVDSFNRVERLFGHARLEQSLASGIVGPAVTLPLHVLGEQLEVLERATMREKLVARLRVGDRAATSELHALALCALDEQTEVEIEPEINVGGKPRIPDFRLRMPGEQWVHVEVTAPAASETAEAAQSAATSIVASTDLRDGMAIQIRFRREPTDEDLERVVSDVAAIENGGVIDRETYVMHAQDATPEITSIGSDERDRPIYGCLRGTVEGDRRAFIVVRVPYTDDRAQQVIDAEAKQLPKEGPGLICVCTTYGAYWRGLIERSYSPTIRRRISGVFLFQIGLVTRERGYAMPTIGRLLINPHARTALPEWLRAGLEAIPAEY